MLRSMSTKLALLGALFIVVSLVLQPALASTLLAQGVPPAAETTATEPATATPTDEPPTATATAEPPTNTPTDAPTDVPPATATNTPEGTSVPEPPTSTPRPPSSPPPAIPEPVTIVLFGSGLAALSAAVAARRRKE